MHRRRRGVGAVGDEAEAPLSLRFTDVDVTGEGFQSGWAHLAEEDVAAGRARAASAGPPGGAAVRLSRADDVDVVACAFAALGAGGVRAHGPTSRLVVAANTFDGLLAGSAVALTGGARAGGVGAGARVVGNRARALGALLPSVAGVLCASCRESVIANNTVARGARWGVHVRSGPGPWDHRAPGGAAADATGVVVEGNVLVGLCCGPRG